MDWTTLLFGFRGRINRGRYWFALLLYMLAWACFIGLCFVWLGEFDPALLLRTAGSAPMIRISALILAFFWGWLVIAIGIKRLHDRGKSGHWLWLFIGLPVVLGVIAYAILIAEIARLSQTGGNPGSGFWIANAISLLALPIYIWAFIELGCLRGTRGPNQYGPDPIPHIP